MTIGIRGAEQPRGSHEHRPFEPNATMGQTRPMRSFVDQVVHYFERPHVGVPDGPVGGDTAWLGADLADDTSWTVPIGPAAIAELRSTVADVTTFDVESSSRLLQPSATPALFDDVATWRRDLTAGRGFVVVKGFPVTEWTSVQCEAACWIIGQLLGEPGAQNSDGDLLGHVRDLGPANHADERLYRTNQNIRFHCDAAEVVGLMCLATSPHGGRSRLVSSTTVHDLLHAESPALAARLFEPMRLDARQPADSHVRYTHRQLAAFDGERIRTFMHLDYLTSIERFDGVELDAVERACLERWETIAESPGVHLEMALEPGDLQLVNNHFVVHARTAYRDDLGAPRHLLRLWLSLPDE